MLEVTLGFEIVAGAALLALCGGFFWFSSSISARISKIEDKIEQSSKRLERLNDSEPLLDTLKDSMAELIEDTLSNMQPPSAFDHIAGAVAQMLQMKMMKSMEILPPVLQDGLNDLMDDEPLNTVNDAV